MAKKKNDNKIKNKEHPNAYTKRRRIDEVIDLRLQGKTYRDIYDILSLKYKNFSTTLANQYYVEAGKIIDDLLNDSILHARTIHADRYEFFYKKLLEWGYDKQAMIALENIERLVGIHSPYVQFNIENVVQNKRQQGDIYDYNNLTPDERKRLKVLVDKCTKGRK